MLFEQGYHHDLSKNDNTKSESDTRYQHKGSSPSESGCAEKLLARQLEGYHLTVSGKLPSGVRSVYDSRAADCSADWLTYKSLNSAFSKASSHATQAINPFPAF